jgi:hypothetical protein
MPLGTARPHGSHGDFINHCTGIRLRIVGAGNLNLTLFAPDGVASQTLVPIPLSATTRVHPFRLANFNQYRMQLSCSTTVIDEVMRVNRIIVFMKPIATMEPA